MNVLKKLNLGSGKNPLYGYVNVDKYGNPDVLHDLETFPWPWDDNSIIEIRMNHVLEHLGETTALYYSIIKEIYRICIGGAEIFIAVPHPRHDDFMNDPSHIRIVTPQSLDLFSKANNREWIKNGFANSPLGLYLDVDFILKSVDYILDPVWTNRLHKKEVSEAQIDDAFRNFNNVVKEIRMLLRVVK